MKTATIREAKAHLNELVSLAEKGEEVFLMRGSKLVARLEPMREEDFELHEKITDEQAERFWKRVAEDHKAGRFEAFPSFETAVRTLRRRLKTPVHS